MLQREEFLVRELLESGVITEDDVERARRHAAEERVALTAALVSIGVVTSRDLAIAQATVYECCFVALEDFDVSLQHAELLPRSAAERLVAFPLFVIDNVVTVAMRDPMDFKAVDQLRQRLKHEVEPVLCEPEALRRLITRAYSMLPAERVQDEDEAPRDLTTGEEPIVVATREMLVAAIEQGASDIHITPDQKSLHVRYRVDGVLRVQQGPPLSAHDALVRRLKVLAELDLTQTRKPQDGKIRFPYAEKDYDLRISVLPTVCGESVVIRILRPDNAFSGLEDLGMDEASLETLSDAIERPHGMILVTGPTGSGKTTTLYTALARLNTPERSVMTVEDPVEIRMCMVRQTQVNNETGVSFASALRSMLRQDPDVILVGEIRDAETAKIAVQASLTGHLVLSTLHTNDAVGAIERLRDLGAPPFAINCSLLCVVAQRLIRRVCDRCAQPYSPTDAERETFALTDEQAAGLREGAGCPSCRGVGYRGRIGVYESLRMSPAIGQAIHDQRPPIEIRRIAQREGMRLMIEDGLDKALRGVTTLAELLKVRATVDDFDDAPQADHPREVRLSA